MVGCTKVDLRGEGQRQVLSKKKIAMRATATEMTNSGYAAAELALRRDDFT
jgi:hypothetical protein